MSERRQNLLFVAAHIGFVCYLVAVIAVVCYGVNAFRDVNAGPLPERWRHNQAYRDSVESLSTILALSLCCVTGVVALDRDFWWESLLLYMFGFVVTYSALSYLPEVHYPGISFGGEFDFACYSIGCTLVWLAFVAIGRLGRG